MSLANPYYVGVQNVGSYQVSGVPFVSGNITVPISSSTPVEITFPEVTQRIIVENVGTEDLRVGFSANGVKETNYFIVHEHGGGTPSVYHHVDFRVKVSSIYLLSNTGATTTACVAAELTNVNTELLSNSGPSGSNWSGSVGVG